MFGGLDSLEFDAGWFNTKTSFYEGYPPNRIKHFSIQNAWLHVDRFLHQFPALESLNITNCSVDDWKTILLKVFRGSPQLKTFSCRTSELEIWTGWPQTVFFPSEIEGSPTLEHLETIDVIETSWASALLLINLPSLRNLRFEGIADQYFSNLFGDWVAKSSKLLTELSLIRVTVSNDVVLAAVCACPALEVLILNDFFDTSNMIIEVLTGRTPSPQLPPEQAQLPAICPRLRHLDISGCPDVRTSSVHTFVKERLSLFLTTGGNSDAVGSELTQRVAKVNRLEVLRMDRCPNIDGQWIPWFKEHVSHVSCVFASASNKRQQRNLVRRVNGI
ncbi:hypothetical protein NP233_g11649 [Leucocoprinus birnbaumii]|uniref:Uncharacterized protein n=1 Tax=Leucocoprinus birnbaumii TaxID=56174 RepID=A0AAD5VG55_9AGAR|nr:hypothetical protein NP233_g11649 [Leucocoprinus birnbaumii]